MIWKADRRAQWTRPPLFLEPLFLGAVKGAVFLGAPSRKFLSSRGTFGQQGGDRYIGWVAGWLASDYLAQCRSSHILLLVGTHQHITLVNSLLTWVICGPFIHLRLTNGSDESQFCGHSYSGSSPKIFIHVVDITCGFLSLKTCTSFYHHHFLQTECPRWFTLTISCWSLWVTTSNVWKRRIVVYHLLFYQRVLTGHQG